MPIRRSAVLLLAALSLSPLGCDLLGGNTPSENVASGVYVANAGGFGNGNSSVTIYDPSTQQTQHLPASRPGFASYIQSLTVTDDRFYVLFGETNRVGVFTTDSLEQVSQISTVRNPRYMTTFEGTGYVTGQDYGSSPSPKLYQVNLSTNEIVDSVDVGGTPEDVAVRSTRVYVALGGQDGSIAVVNPNSMTVQQTLPVDCDAPRSLAFDRQEELLVFCSGSTIYNENFEVVDRTDGAIRVVNTNTTKVTTEIPLDTMLTSASQGQRVFYSSDSDEAFAVLADQTIVRFDASANEIADEFPASGDPIGAIAYDADARRLYLGRTAPSNPFSAEGTVTVHRRDGAQASSFGAGVAPTHIDFRRNDR